MASLYTEIGVERGASAEDIKKAYKKEALSRHPDRGGDKAGFQRLQAAYDTLSDPQKRAHYDATGEIPNGEQQGGMPDMSAMFGSMFGGPFGGQFGGPFGFGPGSPGIRPEKGPNKLHDIGVCLADLYAGKNFTLHMKRDVICHGCSGEGGSRMASCNACGGKGLLVRAIRMGPIMSMSHEPCGTCGQSGKRIVEECRLCHGRKLLENESNLEVVIEPGMQEGDRLVFAGKCSESTQYNTPGDVVLVIRSISGESEAWVRKGSELTYVVHLTLAESLLGWSRNINGHPSGKPLHILWKNGILRDGENIRISGWGMPERVSGTPERAIRKNGDLVILCRVNLSQRILADDQRQILKKVWTDWNEPTEKEGYVTGRLAGAY